jgi:hypothetical protein
MIYIENHLKGYLERTMKNKELIYFLLDHEDTEHSYVKIGCSAVIDHTDLESPVNQTAVFKRLGGCQTGNPRPLIMIGYLYGEEKYWHNVFSSHLVEGEWFHYQPIKHIILNLRLAPVRKALEKHQGNLLKNLWNYYYRHNSRPSMKAEQERWDNAYDKEKRQIERLTYEQYITSSEENYKDIAQQVIRNRFKTGRGQLENNAILHEYKGNYEFITRVIDTMFTAHSQIKTKAKNSIIDLLGDVIHEGEPYFNLEGSGWEASGISLRNGVKLSNLAGSSITEHAYKLVEKDRKELEIEGLYTSNGYEKMEKNAE